MDTSERIKNDSLNSSEKVLSGFFFGTKKLYSPLECHMTPINREAEGPCKSLLRRHR